MRNDIMVRASGVMRVVSGRDRRERIKKDGGTIWSVNVPV